MTTSVTIKNNGPGRVNVNEVEPSSPAIAGQERTAYSHMLEVGDSVTLSIWGIWHYLCVLETAFTGERPAPPAPVGRADERCFECDTPLIGPICQACNPPVGRADEWTAEAVRERAAKIAETPITVRNEPGYMLPLQRFRDYDEIASAIRAIRPPGGV